MNTGTVNGFSLNGTPLMGSNSVLSGGFTGNGSFHADLVTGVVLTGGIFTAPNTGGNVSTSLLGGCDSQSGISSSYFITGFLMGGLFSQGSLSSTLVGVSDALQGGVESPSSWGGAIIADARLRVPDNVGSTGVLSGGIQGSTKIAGGVSKTSQVGGGIQGNTRLASGGVVCTSQVGGTLREGVKLQGFLASNAFLDGKRKTHVKLQDGLRSNSTPGNFLKVTAKLQDGIMNTGSYQTKPMRVSPHLNNGISSHTLLDSRIILSPRGQGGVNSPTSTAGGKQQLSPRLQGSLYSGYSFSSKMLVISVRLQGESPQSTCTSGAGIRISARLHSGVDSQSSKLGGDIAQSFVDPLLNTGALEIRSATVLLQIQTPIEDI